MSAQMLEAPGAALEAFSWREAGDGLNVCFFAATPHLVCYAEQSKSYMRVDVHCFRLICVLTFGLESRIYMVVFQN